MLLVALVILFSCKNLPVANDWDRHFSYSLTRYRRTKADMPPIIVGQVSVNAKQERGEPLWGTFFLDGQRLTLNEADRVENYVLSVSPGTHRLQLVTITYRTTEASFRVKTGDSLRIDFQLQQEKRPLH